MKKKLATLLMLIFVCLCALTGCNLWRSDGYANLGAIVATNGDIKITRESLITAYNNSGYYYDQYYGYTREKAIELTIDSLVNREYLLRYIDSLAETDPTYKLSKQETYEAIKETWDYVDNSIKSIVEQIRKELGLSKEDISTESETSSSSNSDYKKKTGSTKKFEYSNGRIVKLPVDSDSFVPDVLPDVYSYKMNLRSSSEDYKRLVWDRYITALKANQRSYKYSEEEMKDDAVFKMEIEKSYKTNLENKKLSKFEAIYSQSYGLDQDKKTGEWYVNDETLLSIIDKYKTTYNGNKELYNLSSANSNILEEEDVRNNYYNLLTTSSSREDYLFYGKPSSDETLITCIHVLIKLGDEQTKKAESYDAPKYQIKDPNNPGQSWADTLKAEVKSPDNTYGFYRTYDEEGKATESKTGTSVTQIYNEILERIENEVAIKYNRGSKEYAEGVIKLFDEYIYTYNQDTGIQNAKFDYIVGTKTSAMVASFTEVVRSLYNNGIKDETLNLKKDAEYKKGVELLFPNGVGFAGAISAPILEEASNYSGYHIVLYTGTLNNIEANSLTINNVWQKLGEVKTSVGYGQSLFEFVYDKVTRDTYNAYQTEKVNSIMPEATKRNSSNYSDLLKA